MMKPLRTAHRWVWLVLALLLPAGIVGCWLVIPAASAVTILPAPVAELLPVVQAQSENQRYCVYIRSNNEQTRWQLEWKNKLPLESPTAVIYQTAGREANIRNASLVGRIEARGNYVFALTDSTPPQEINLLLYDFIHEKPLDSFNFKPRR
jgi:hypothetical protein